MRFQEVKLLVSDCTMSTLSMISDGISSGNSSQAAVSKPLDSVIIASWKSVPCCSSSLFRYCGAWKSACGTATSSWSRTFRRSTSRLMETARSRQNNTRYRSVKYQLPILSLGRAFFISSNVDTLHFVRGSQEMNCCFFLTVPEHSHWR